MANLNCTSTNVAPTVELVAGAGSAVLGVAAIGEASKSCSGFECIGNDAAKRVAVGAIVVGAVYLASSVYGFSKTSGCREAISWQRACFDGNKYNCDVLTRRTSPHEVAPSACVGEPCASTFDCAVEAGICYEGKCRK
jgi:hypothetical protein